MTQFTEEELALGLQVIETCRELERHGLNQGTAGNISIRLAEREEGFLITPTALPYNLMQPEDIAHMKLDGTRTSRREPSSEWRIHLDIMRRRPEVGAVIHTHSGHATALACLRQPIPSFHYMVALFGGEDIRCSEYATFGTQELSDRVLEALEGRCAALMGNHGLIVLGPNLQRAMAFTVEAETLAMMYLRAISAGEPALLPPAEMELVKGKLATYLSQGRLKLPTP